MVSNKLSWTRKWWRSSHKTTLWLLDINFGLKSKYLKVDAAGFNVIGLASHQWLLYSGGQNFTLATMDNCKKFAVIVSITTICSYINFSHSIWQRPAPKQLWARLTRTLSLVWGRTDKFCQVELNALKEKGGKPPLVSSQKELMINKAFLKSCCWNKPKWK